MKTELIAALTKQNGFSRWNLDGCAIEDIADIAERIFAARSSPAEALSVPAIAEFCATLPESQHATFNALIATAREVGASKERGKNSVSQRKPTVPDDVMEAAEWAVKWSAFGTEAAAHARTIRDWLKSISTGNKGTAP